MFPSEDKYLVNLTIPEGYEVDYLPEPINLVMENNHSSFKYIVSASNNNIQLQVIFDINSFYISSMAYPALKGFFKLMVEKQTDRIILKKKL